MSTQRLLNAYRNGIFPWYNPDDPLLWWSPDPRGVIHPKNFKLNRSLKKSLRRNQFSFSVNTAFARVIHHCATIRQNEGTWIDENMIAAYNQLHQLGKAHSVEVWQNDQLVGGLYGISVGQVFCGESMFHLVTDASKAAFAMLNQIAIKANIQLIDCQMQNPHLASLGIIEIPRGDFLRQLKQYRDNSIPQNTWQAASIGEMNLG